MDYLKQRFNQKGEYLSPMRVKGFKRHDLLKLFAEEGFTKGAEIGVAEGKFSEAMCDTIPALTELACVDPWCLGDADPRSQQVGGREAAKRKAEAEERLGKYECTAIVDSTSEAAALRFPPDSLDFVYIDGNHTFDYVIQDLILWSRIVRPGGIVAGHDYYRFRWAGVVPAVDAYAAAHRIHDVYLTDERTPSFFWVRP